MQRKHRAPEVPGGHHRQQQLQWPFKPRVTKEEILGDLSRFAQDAYHCPFCRFPSRTHEAQLVHLRVSHPWYSLDVHQGT
ncbi:hypothetical protein H4R21_005623, partial [Coemansia helicoidea]